MGNTSLKNALQQAGLTAEEFAEIIKVDPKSVQRWVDGPTRPYPRNRAAIARALNLTEHELWPEDRQLQNIHAGTGERHAAVSEVTGAWAYTTDESAPDPAAFISNSEGAIDFLDNGRGVELTTALVAALVEQANTGRSIRLLTCLPKLRLGPLIGHEKVEVRVLEGGAGYWLARIGDTMLLTFNLAGEGDQPPPLIRLDRAVDAGLVDRLADNFEALWDGADEILNDPRQLDAYLTNTDEDDPDEDSPGPAGPGTPPAPGPAPRRWPGRTT